MNMFKQEHIDLSYGFDAVSNSLLDDTPNGDYLLDDSRGITWGVKCFLPNCDTTKRNTPRARFFRFPKHNHELFSRWMVACGYRTLPARYNRYLCHKHFDPSCFGKRRLKTDSIPTLNLPKFLSLKDFRDEEPNTKCELIEAPQLEQMLPEIEVTTEYAEIETPPVECQYSIQKSQYVTQNNYSNYEKQSHIQQNNYSNYEKQSQIQQNNYNNYEKQSQIQYSDLPDDLSDIPPDENETEEPICCSCIENREKVESFRQKYDALLQKYQNLRKMHEKYQKFYYYNNQHSKDGQNENKVMIQQQIKNQNHNQNQNQNRSFNPFSKNNMLNQSVPPLKISLPIKTSTPNQNSIKSEHMNQSMNQNLNPNKSQNLNHETTQRKKKSESRKKNSQNHKSSKKPPSQNYNKSQSYYSDTLKRSCTKTVIDYTIADSTTSDDSDESFLPSAQRRRSASKKYKKSNW